jgi:hypothetical protein
MNGELWLPPARFFAMMPVRGARGKMRNSIVNLILNVRLGRCFAGRQLAAGMTILIGTLIYVTTADAGFFRPATGRYCARETIGLNDCSYDTYAQCMATLSGIGGVCSENLQAPPPYVAAPRPRKRHSKHHRSARQ